MDTRRRGRCHEHCETRGIDERNMHVLTTDLVHAKFQPMTERLRGILNKVCKKNFLLSSRGDGLEEVQREADKRQDLDELGADVEDVVDRPWTILDLDLVSNLAELHLLVE